MIIRTTAELARPARVLLALEPTGINPASLQLAVQLSHSLKAELRSLLMEDLALLRAATLPFAREIRGSGEDHPLDPVTLERSLRVSETRLREQVARQVEPRGIVWSMRSLRGSGLAALLDEWSLTDFMVLGRAPRTPWSTLPATGHAMLLYRNSDDLTHAQQVLSDLARSISPPLPQLTVETLRWVDVAQSLPLLRRCNPGLILLAGGSACWPSGELRALLEGLDCPVLLLPGEPSA
ncbi:hypothetical protein N8H22_05910 [Stutzerimonas stutzeri]|uniref:hypothetical protein n=1 Tax=Stutzerimonas sp. S1 TaxID=3030652 RepID=UPI00222531CF|nr:hypothetical protein [Stutzerimonas sp. S1]MCW3148142.1 hypothetical protein [Stutzerimonas sp. S1]